VIRNGYLHKLFAQNSILLFRSACGNSADTNPSPYYGNLRLQTGGEDAAVAFAVTKHFQ
jgi:hypothetical protein